MGRRPQTQEQKEATRLRRNAYMKARYHNDIEKSREYKRSWDQKNSDKRKQYSSDYYQRNQDHLKKASLDYYYSHHEECLARQFAYDKRKKMEALADAQ